jgi:hypothetical protein
MIIHKKNTFYFFFSTNTMICNLIIRTVLNENNIFPFNMRINIKNNFGVK